MDAETYSDRWFGLLGRMAWAAHLLDDTLGYVTAWLHDDHDNVQELQEAPRPGERARKAAQETGAADVLAAVDAAELAEQRRNDVLHTSFAVLVHVDGEPGGLPQAGPFPRVGRTRADREGDVRRAITPTAGEISEVLHEPQKADWNLMAAATTHMRQARQSPDGDR